MGTSVIRIEVVGSHGCDRKAQEGETLGPICASPYCVDCRARDAVAALVKGGNSIVSATLTHWPGQSGGDIVDDLHAGKRIAKHF